MGGFEISEKIIKYDIKKQFDDCTFQFSMLAVQTAYVNALLRQS